MVARQEGAVLALIGATLENEKSISVYDDASKLNGNQLKLLAKYNNAKNKKVPARKEDELITAWE
jgi:hypothetical protein